MPSGIPGFTQSRVDVGDVTLSVHIGGEGPPLILLHGYPQNHMCWAGVAPALAQSFRVIVPDLRGYGDSDAPPDDGTTRSIPSGDGAGHRRRWPTGWGSTGSTSSATTAGRG